jgi:hypothetical protein
VFPLTLASRQISELPVHLVQSLVYHFETQLSLKALRRNRFEADWLKKKLENGLSHCLRIRMSCLTSIPRKPNYMPAWPRAISSPRSNQAVWPGPIRLLGGQQCRPCMTVRVYLAVSSRVARVEERMEFRDRKQGTRTERNSAYLGNSVTNYPLWYKSRKRK